MAGAMIGSRVPESMRMRLSLRSGSAGGSNGTIARISMARENAALPETSKLAAMFAPFE